MNTFENLQTAIQETFNSNIQYVLENHSVLWTTLPHLKKEHDSKFAIKQYDKLLKPVLTKEVTERTPAREITTKLYKEFLKLFSEEEREEHVCGCCKSFLETYGHIVFLKNGILTSLLFGTENEEHYDFLLGFNDSVLPNDEKPELTLFCSEADPIGGHKTKGGFGHLHLDLKNGIAAAKLGIAKSIVNNLKQSADLFEQLSAKYHQLNKGANNLIQKILKEDTYDLVINSYTPYKNMVKYVELLNENCTRLELYDRLNDLPGKGISISRAMNSPYGVYLENRLEKGDSREVAKNKYLEMCRGENYMVSSAEINEFQYKAFLKVVEDLDLEKSLQRKAPNLDYVKEHAEIIWEGVMSDVPELSDHEKTLTEMCRTIKGKRESERDAVRVEFIDLSEMIKTGMKSLTLLRSSGTVSHGSYSAPLHSESNKIFRDDNLNALCPWSYTRLLSLPLSFGGELFKRVRLIHTNENKATYFFVLEGTFHDILKVWNNGNANSCLFSELLLPELHEHRKAIERYNQNSKLTVAEDSVYQFSLSKEYLFKHEVEAKVELNDGTVLIGILK